MMLRDDLFAVPNISRPVDGADDDRLIPDDGTGVPLAGKRRNPPHVLLGGAAPNDGQILLCRVAKTGRAAETGPVRLDEGLGR
jgi:hypothetical protein